MDMKLKRQEADCESRILTTRLPKFPPSVIGSPDEGAQPETRPQDGMPATYTLGAHAGSPGRRARLTAHLCAGRSVRSIRSPAETAASHAETEGRRPAPARAA